MARKKHDEEEEAETLGSDLEQLVAMLEKAEIDYDQETDEEGNTDVMMNGHSVMSFDEDGNLLDVSGA